MRDITKAAIKAIKKRKNQAVMKNKDFHRAIAAACYLPLDKSKEILDVILAYLVKNIKKDKIVKLRGFGSWTIWKPNLPKGLLNSPTEIKKLPVSFAPCPIFRWRYLNDNDKRGRKRWKL